MCVCVRLYNLKHLQAFTVKWCVCVRVCVCVSAISGIKPDGGEVSQSILKALLLLLCVSQRLQLDPAGQTVDFPFPFFSCLSETLAFYYCGEIFFSSKRFVEA